jgi:hypothetical protein
MAGYTRQSLAQILNGEIVSAPPLNAEFNQILSRRLTTLQVISTTVLLPKVRQLIVSLTWTRTTLSS